MQRFVSHWGLPNLRIWAKLNFELLPRNVWPMVTFVLNKRIPRFILNYYSSHLNTLLNKVEMTSLYNKRIQNFLILVYKSLFFNEYPTYMRNMFTVRYTNYNLRRTHMLTLNKPRTTTYGLHYFSYFSAQQWNDLPDELRGSTFNDFKPTCRVWIRLLVFTNFKGWH